MVQSAFLPCDFSVLLVLVRICIGVNKITNLGNDRIATYSELQNFSWFFEPADPISYLWK